MMHKPVAVNDLISNNSDAYSRSVDKSHMHWNIRICSSFLNKPPGAWYENRFTNLLNCSIRIIFSIRLRLTF
jgi:hypothetical protein